ncbi:hypothetical protein PWT90_09436 [Aphanocladium album]|nr:hypothetical protein PWT90_09436 [Aphanocladium album]
MVHRTSVLAIAPLVARYALAQAQQYSISTTEFTTCGPVPTQEPPKTGGNGIITVVMPACPDCKCECAHTKTYTTIYETVCPTGVTQVTYTVAEVYKGISTAPVVVSTEIPHGFTTTVTACDVCGPETVTKTLTIPITAQQTGGPALGAQQPGGQQPGGQRPGGGKNGTNPNPPVIGSSSKLQTVSSLLLAAAAAAIL